MSKKILLTVALVGLVTISGCVALNEQPSENPTPSENPADIRIEQQYTQLYDSAERTGNYSVTVTVTNMTVDSIKVHSPYDTDTINGSGGETTLIVLSPGDTVQVVHNNQTLKTHTVKKAEPQAGVTFNQGDYDNDGQADDVQVQVVSMEQAKYVTIHCKENNNGTKLTEVAQIHECINPGQKIVVTATLDGEPNVIQTYKPK